MRIRRVKIDKSLFLLPVLSQSRSVGVDSSSIENKTTILAFCFIPDHEAAYTYLERHMVLPKTHNHQEFKWSKLNRDYRRMVLENLKILLVISCEALLLIETDAIISPKGKFEDLFKNLIEGCFSGYGKHPNYSKLRPNLRKRLFQLANNDPVHCDKDFPHLTSDKAVRLFVQTLARRDGWYEQYTPLYAPLKSHESKPIQITDIIVGAFKTKVQNNESLEPLSPLPFDKRKIGAFKGRYARAYYWAP